jgi:hypothetical protein
MTGIGSYFPDRDQPLLSSEEADVVRRFHELYYGHWLAGGADTKNLSWFGHLIIKCPLDLWVYHGSTRSCSSGLAPTSWSRRERGAAVAHSIWR